MTQELYQYIYYYNYKYLAYLGQALVKMRTNLLARESFSVFERFGYSDWKRCADFH